MGDTIAVFSVDTEEAKKEAELLFIENSLFSHKTININTNLMPYQDNAMGLYLMDANNVNIKKSFM